MAFVLYKVGSNHPKFAWALLAWLTVFLGGSLTFLFSKSHLVYISAEARSRVVGHVVDIFSNISSVWLFFRQKHELKLLSHVAQHAADKERTRDLF